MKRIKLSIAGWVALTAALAPVAVALPLAALSAPERTTLARSTQPRVAAAAPAARPRPAPAAQPKAPAPELVVRRVLDIDGGIAFGEYHWQPEDAPAGPLVITVDLHAQTMSVFRNGHEIGATAILYGDDEKPTPLGAYPITEKDADHVSNLYGAPMPYMLRLTNDGISIHGTSVEEGYATHGCIGIPTAFAKLLFAEAKLGDRVIITRGKLLKLGDPIVA